MIYSLTGELKVKRQNFFVLGIGGVGYRIYTSAATISALPGLEKEVKIFCHLHVKEDILDLYGFLDEINLELFSSLISISGVGPKSALNILGIAKIEELIVAINEGRVDLLSKASGIGKKTAERIVLEIKGKLTFANTSDTIGKMESDIDLEETLISLGYNKASARVAISKIDPEIKGFNERLKAALKNNNK